MTHIAHVMSQVQGASHGKMFHASGNTIALAVPNKVDLKHVEVPLQRMCVQYYICPRLYSYRSRSMKC